MPPAEGRINPAAALPGTVFLPRHPGRAAGSNQKPRTTGTAAARAALRTSRRVGNHPPAQTVPAALRAPAPTPGFRAAPLLAGRPPASHRHLCMSCAEPTQSVGRLRLPRGSQTPVGLRGKQLGRVPQAAGTTDRAGSRVRRRRLTRPNLNPAARPPGYIQFHSAPGVAPRGHHATTSRDSPGGRTGEPG